MISLIFSKLLSKRKANLRFNALKIYLRRLFLWLRTNRPFLSGDAFITLSDQFFSGPRFWSFVHPFRRTKLANVTFMPTHLVKTIRFEQLLSQSCKILILGNSDYDLTEHDVRRLSQLPVEVYAQNLNHRAVNVNVMPIGLENRRLGVNGLKRFYKDSNFSSYKENKILVGPFSMTHPERMELLTLQAEIGPWDFLEGRMNLRDYSRISAGYKFVACPRGNGLDTHRFWETLYRGSIPIVLRSNWSEMISELGIPVLMVDKWDGSSLKETILQEIATVNPREIQALWINYWENRFLADN